MLVYSCRHCGKTYEVDDSIVGRRVRCKACGEVSRVEPDDPRPAVLPRARPIPTVEPAVPAPPRARYLRAGQNDRKRGPGPINGLGMLILIGTGGLALVQAFSAFVYPAEPNGPGWLCMTLIAIGQVWFVWGACWTLFVPKWTWIDFLVPCGIHRLFSIYKYNSRSFWLIVSGVGMCGLGAFIAVQMRDSGARRSPRPGIDYPRLGPGFTSSSYTYHSEVKVSPAPVRPRLQTRPADLPALPAIVWEPYPPDSIVDVPPLFAPSGLNYRDVGPLGSRLIGLRIGFLGEDASSKLASVQPVYLRDETVLLGDRYGVQTGPQVEVLARPGYAVGGLRSIAPGPALDGLEIVFMKVHGDVLDPGDSYVSPWIGSLESGRMPRSDLSESQTVVGICGTRSERSVKEVGIVHRK